MIRTLRKSSNNFKNDSNSSFGSWLTFIWNVIVGFLVMIWFFAIIQTFLIDSLIYPNNNNNNNEYYHLHSNNNEASLLHLKNMFHPKSPSVASNEVIVREYTPSKPLYALSSSSSSSSNIDVKDGDSPSMSDWSVLFGPKYSKKDGHDLPPRPFMRQIDKPTTPMKSPKKSKKTKNSQPKSESTTTVRRSNNIRVVTAMKNNNNKKNNGDDENNLSQANVHVAEMATDSDKHGVQSNIPSHELKWPPLEADGSLRETEGYEVMPMTNLKVPRFWEPRPNTDPNQAKDYVNGHESIYLMIASYRDFQCHETINSALMRADHPERVFIGAVDQVVPGDVGCLTTQVSCDQDPEQLLCKHRHQITVYTMHAGMATGPVTARHIGDRLYRGQHFVMQLDAHCWFVRHWDTSIIKQFYSAHNEMAVLSTYLTDIQGSIDRNGDSTRNTRPIMCNSDFEGLFPQRYLRHGSQPEDVSPIPGVPQLQPFWAAGFSFSRGHFKVRVPYDSYQPMVFQGEEISCGIRGFTHGYDFYAPHDSVVFHEYAERSKRRKKVKLFWENSGKHRGEGQKSLKRSMAIIGMAPDIKADLWDHAEEKKYGLGDKRDVNLFYKLFLIDTHERKATQLCPFVKSGKMHREFIKYLKQDGSGIDYDAEGLKSFDTKGALEDVYASQRPMGLSWLNTAVKRHSKQGLMDALKNAKRIGIDHSNKQDYDRAVAELKRLGGSID